MYQFPHGPWKYPHRRYRLGEIPQYPIPKTGVVSPDTIRELENTRRRLRVVQISRISWRLQI